MGDRTIIYHPCPQCHKEMETFDAPSSLMYISRCDHCGYKDRRDYFETNENEVRLITPEQLEELKKKNQKIRKFRRLLEKLEQEQRIAL
jgi:uncharacterized Zn finger protein